MKYILIFLTCIVILRVGFFYLFPFKVENGQHLVFQTTLLEDPKILGNNQQFSVRVGDFWKSTTIRIQTKSDTEFLYGQTLEVNGTIKERLLSNKQTIMTIQNPEIKAKNSGFLPLFSQLRQKIVAFCENNFSQPYSGLLVGIIFGIKNLLTDQITTSFRITGLSHIVAASGMNVTLVAGFLFGIFGSFLRRQLAIAMSIGGILLYVCISGFDASIIRASLMGSIAFSASFFGRQYGGQYALFLVGGLMLLWDPLLLNNVGFQLSVLATEGILVLTPLGSLRQQAGQEPSIWSSFSLSDDLRTTLAAQLATLPILLLTFGQYSLLSIIANALVLWTIPLIMTIGGVGIVVGLVFEPLGRLLVTLVIPLLWYLEHATAFFSTHSILVQVDTFPIAFFVGYYCLLIAVILFLRKKDLAVDKKNI